MERKEIESYICFNATIFTCFVVVVVFLILAGGECLVQLPVDIYQIHMNVRFF